MQETTRLQVRLLTLIRPKGAGGAIPPFFMKRILSQENGITEIFHHDEQTDESVIETIQDVEPYLETAKAMRNDADYSKEGIKRDWWHIGHIPDSIILKMRYEDGVNIYDRNDWKAVGKLLNDKYSLFLTTSGKHKFKT